jgi:hypothetical protein
MSEIGRIGRAEVLADGLFFFGFGQPALPGYVSNRLLDK